MHKSLPTILASVILLFIGVLLIYCGINKLNHPAIYFISSFIIILCTIVVFVFRSKN